MIDGTALPAGMRHDGGAALDQAGGRSSGLRVRLTSRLADVESAWCALQTPGIESPGQDLAFTRHWIDRFAVPESRQLYVLGELAGQPVALLPLVQRSFCGLSLLTWFPGRHVGCNAPLVDRRALSAMTAEDRAGLWRTMTADIRGVDSIYLAAVPHDTEIFDQFGSSIETDTLFRAEFTDWEEADRTQRSKSRRKHDRQQGDRLDALGAVSFEEIAGGGRADEVIATMFAQRAARFSAMGVRDPFAREGVRGFYASALERGSGVDVRLHVLRLNGDIVAIRYNIVRGERMFCLISSMSDDPHIQSGSPGKQCLLRVMQSVFDGGIRSFDMGSGFTDEKRHWCNTQIPVRSHYYPLTAAGRLAAFGHRRFKLVRRQIKTDPKLMSMARRVRALTGRVGGGANHAG